MELEHRQNMPRRYHAVKRINYGVKEKWTPTDLQNAAFFVVDKMFCLCGGQDHRGLCLSQLKRFDNKYVYYENTSKNRNGTFKQLRVKNKVAPLHPCPEAGERCPVAILDKYISKRQSQRERSLLCTTSGENP